jgi:hypothetical protein
VPNRFGGRVSKKQPEAKKKPLQQKQPEKQPEEAEEKPLTPEQAHAMMTVQSKRFPWHITEED